MRRIRLFTVLVCMSTVLGGIVTAGPAVAATPPPANDLISGATVAILPSSFTVDTTGATSDADDAQADGSNPDCHNPYQPTLNNSVWYKFTAVTSGTLGVDATASDYTAGVAIATGTPGALTVVACGAGVTSTPTVAGATYYIDAFDLVGSTGGALNIKFSVPAQPTLSVTVDRSGAVDRSTNTVGLSGSSTCTNANYAAISGQVRQIVGRYYINGYLQADIGPCDGHSHPWAGNVVGATGQFGSGSATLLAADAYACNVFACTDVPVPDASLRLRTIRGIDPPPPPPPSGSFSLTVNPTGTVNRATNIATIGGTVTCTGDDAAYLFGSVRQVVGRMFVDGGAYTDLGLCDGSPHSWSVDVLAYTGLYDSGTATVIASAGTCNADYTICTGVDVNTRIRLNATGKRSRFGAPAAGPGSPGLVVNVDRVGSLDLAHNTATIGGVLTCTATASNAALYVTVRQLAGRMYIDGSADLYLGPCDGLPHRWSLAVAGTTGRFVPGSAVALGSAYACGEFDCAETPISVNVRLRPARTSSGRH